MWLNRLLLLVEYEEVTVTEDDKHLETEEATLLKGLHSNSSGLQRGVFFFLLLLVC